MNRNRKDCSAAIRKNDSSLCPNTEDRQVKNKIRCREYTNVQSLHSKGRTGLCLCLRTSIQCLWGVPPDTGLPVGEGVGAGAEALGDLLHPLVPLYLLKLESGEQITPFKS